MAFDAAPSASWRLAVVAEAMTWLRTPYHHNARVKGAGVDCGQFIIAAFVGAGLVPDFDTGDYSADWMMHRSEERYLSFVERHLNRCEQPLPGDVAVWRFGHCFSHGAVVVDWPRVLHAFLHENAVCLGDADKGMLSREHLEAGGSVPRPVRFYTLAGRG